MKTLYEHAWVLTMDEEMHAYRDGWLLTDGAKIAAVGEGPFTGACDKREDLHGGILFPGFVNTHCHASMTPFRSMGDDCPDRLRRFLFPLENKAMTRELVYAGARCGAAEMLRAGITTFVDMYYFEDEVARVCHETGLRGYLGETLIGQTTCDSAQPYGGFDIAERMLETYRGDDLVRPILAPHGTTTCDEACLRRAHELACRYDTLITLHASEMDYEMEHFARMGTTPTGYLHRIGALDAHMLAAHCIHLTDGDVALLAQSGASVAHCIGSNTKAGKGVAPVAALAKAGVPFALGTDGPSSGNTLSMFDQMRLFAVSHKTANHDRGLFPAAQIVAAATRGGARALHAEHEFGMLKPGMRADFAVVRTDGLHMFPVYNPYSALVYSANASDVTMTVAGGVVRVRDGSLTQMDEGRVREELMAHMGPFLRAASRYADMI